MFDGINSKAVYIKLVDEPFDPSTQRFHNRRIFRVEVRKRKDIVTNGAILHVGLIVGLSYLTRVVIERGRIERRDDRIVNRLAIVLQLDKSARTTGKR